MNDTENSNGILNTSGNLVDKGYGLIYGEEKAQERAERKDLNKERKDLLGKIKLLTEKSPVFAGRSKFVDDTVRYEISQAFGYSILSKIFKELPNLKKTQGERVEIPHHMSDKLTMDAIIYNVSDDFKITQWEDKGGMFGGQYFKIEINDSEGRLAETILVKDKDERLVDWKRNRYNEDNTEDRIGISFTTRGYRLGISKFDKEGSLLEKEEMTIYSDNPESAAADIEKASDEAGKYLNIHYSNSGCSFRELEPENNEDGNIARFDYIGFSELIHGPFSRPTGGGSTMSGAFGLPKIIESDENGWKKIKSDYSSGSEKGDLLITKLDDNTVELTAPNKTKATFQVQIDLKEFQRSLVKECLYK